MRHYERKVPTLMGRHEYIQSNELTQTIKSQLIALRDQTGFQQAAQDANRQMWQWCRESDNSNLIETGAVDFAGDWVEKRPYDLTREELREACDEDSRFIHYLFRIESLIDQICDRPVVSTSAFSNLAWERVLAKPPGQVLEIESIGCSRPDRSDGQGSAYGGQAASGVSEEQTSADELMHEVLVLGWRDVRKRVADQLCEPDIWAMVDFVQNRLQTPQEPVPVPAVSDCWMNSVEAGASALDQEEAAEQQESGPTIKELAQTAGVSKHVVWRVREKAGVSIGKKGYAASCHRHSPESIDRMLSYLRDSGHHLRFEMLDAWESFSSDDSCADAATSQH